MSIRGDRELKYYLESYQIQIIEKDKSISSKVQEMKTSL